MQEVLKSRLDKSFHMPTELWQEIADSSKQITLKKNEVLIPYCSLKRTANIVIEGSLKQSIVLLDGSKSVNWFFFDYLFNVAICFDSYYLDEFTKYEISAIENSIVFEIERAKIDDWCNRFPSFNLFYREDVLKSFFLSNEIRNHMISHTPKDFIKYLKQNHSEFIKRIPGKYLAEFMGITPEWFGKIYKSTHRN